MAESAGYAAHAYAESLGQFGRPIRLGGCGGSILERNVPGFSDLDGLGPYPLFACSDWAGLRADLDLLERSLVSIALVADPFGNHSRGLLEETFGDRVIPFKDHHVVDLSRPANAFVSRHHRRNARRSLNVVEVEVCPDPGAVLGDWTRLYKQLILRHGITGIAVFSETAFAKQLEVPGVVVFRAVHGGETVGMTLWYRQSEVAYYHLGAYSAKGYEVGASFAIFWTALGEFAQQGLSWLNLGGGAGLRDDGADGLVRFKRGWSTGTRIAYLCGRILQPERYRQITGAMGADSSAYFPAYRSGEFA